MYIEYLYIWKTLTLFLIIGLLLLLLSMVFVYQEPDKEKLESYECGFNPFGDARSKFEIRYYLVAILFIVSDSELLFILPWVISYINLSIEGIFSMVISPLVLTLGFIHEWNEGALDRSQWFHIQL